MIQLKPIIETARNLITENKIEEALNLIIELLSPIEGQQFNAALLLKTQNQNLRNQRISGVLDKDDEQVLTNQLLSSLLNLLDQIENGLKVIRYCKEGIESSQLEATKKRAKQIIGNDFQLEATKKRTSQNIDNQQNIIFIELKSNDQRVVGNDSVFTINGEAIIGRSPECNIVIKDEFVSRRHCRIYLSENKAYIEDLHSSNGTTWNGSPIQKIHIKSNGILQVDEIAFNLQLIKS